jgi:prephenate dehydrogenase
VSIPHSTIRHPSSGTPLFRQMTIVGVGLIGGSLALAARQAGAVQTVVGVGRSAASREIALARGLVDRATDDLSSGVRDADLVVLAVPVREIVRLLPAVAHWAGPACVVTDVGCGVSGWPFRGGASDRRQGAVRTGRR